MASNSKRAVLSNEGDSVTVFHDGRIKVTSRDHRWEIVEVGRHSALGQYVTLGVGRPLSASETATAAAPTADYTVALTPDRETEVAGTVAATNGTFIQFLHNGSITVGSDGRDIAETFNTGPEANSEIVSVRGGSVTVTFRGSYRPSSLREHDFLVDIPSPEKPALNRLHPGEHESRAGKVGPFR
ncbi:hypothetical protein ASG56_05045 [Rhodococcus sp. Leaf7]|uniref:hypothetical protein n=1 Tax=unclassified Rhodococcus (in: high G+C Gram-positive bacteria) TaxID=192944 RepID=UPI0006F71458|nr:MULTISPECIES: hypothetical protein [unclassified Rhodococcus (in: high G+C Gram-positive bacteria)]KQU06940.1 hypothetical protein ASG56_05045 [Rhodococcus sp. Leaf7]KQU42459.1 hypothetical protein ASG64_05045 [Rhodococcus sp. Leaf247]